MGMSTYLKNELLDHVFKVGAYTQPTNLFVALYTAAPNAGGGGTEVSGTGYAREQHNAWNAASGGENTNDGEVDFGTVGAGGWGTLTHFGIFDASTDGNLLWWGQLTISNPTAEGNPVTFPDDALSFEITEPA